MLELRDVSVSFADTVALERVSLSVAQNEIVAVLGPSGCGKTTLLRVVAGLQHPDDGQVLLNGTDQSDVPTHRRGVGIVFQDHVLFPHQNVAENIGFGLRMSGESRGSRERRVREMLDLVGLTGLEARAVTALSGGEQQRVALARALAPRPSVLLLDEPLGSLDRLLRERLLDDLRSLFRTVEVTAIYVTHDRGEALALGHRVAVMQAGTIAQCDVPDRLWAHPANADVARFLGIGNALDGRIIRPEAVVARRSPAGDAVVEEALREGPTVRLRILLGTGEVLEAVTTSLDHPLAGDRVDVEIEPGGVIELDGA